MDVILAFFIVGVLMAIFRRPLGEFMWTCHRPDRDESRPPKKEGYPYVVGGVGAVIAALSAFIFLMDRFVSK